MGKSFQKKVTLKGDKDELKRSDPDLEGEVSDSMEERKNVCKE